MNFLVQSGEYYDTPIHYIPRQISTGSHQKVDGLLEHPNYSVAQLYPDLTILKLMKPLIINVEGFLFKPSCYYNQFFNQKLGNKDVKKQVY